jgi:hypothetical protein
MRNAFDHPPVPPWHIALLVHAERCQGTIYLDGIVLVLRGDIDGEIRSAYDELQLAIQVWYYCMLLYSILDFITVITKPSCMSPGIKP